MGGGKAAWWLFQFGASAVSEGAHQALTAYVAEHVGRQLRERLGAPGAAVDRPDTEAEDGDRGRDP